MPHFVTSAQAEDHITAANDARMNAGIIGDGSYLLPVRQRLASTMVDSNTIRILGGDASINGYHVAIDGDYEEYTIENGVPGMKRKDLVVWHVETAPQYKLSIEVLKGEDTSGTPVEPEYIQGDLNDGDTVVEVPICSVELEGINPKAPVAMMQELGSMSDIWDSISQSKLIPVISRTVGITVNANSYDGGLATFDLPQGYKLIAVTGIYYEGGDSTGVPISWLVNGVNTVYVWMRNMGSYQYGYRVNIHALAAFSS